MRALAVFGVTLLLITEALSWFGAVRRGPLLLCWAGVCLVSLIWAKRKVFGIRFSPAGRDPIVILCSLGIAAILALTAITAVASPPNSADAMAYHMPRVVYWAEQGSIRFFPTPYLNQIMLQPLAEYFMLHTYVLTGGDRLINLVQWFASVMSILGVSVAAGVLGAGARGQALAALFCATLPSGILASSGAKNDYFLAMWLIAAICFAARFARWQRGRDALALGTALGLALLTKATAYLFAPWLLAAVLVACAARFGKRFMAGLLAAGGLALLLNVPHYARNFELSGSILGYDSAHGDGFFRWRNETFGWKQTASNLLRNLSEQMGGRSDRWNRAVYDATIRAHAWLGVGSNDPNTTWRWSTFEPPKNSNHEANANSRWHLLILTIAAFLAAWYALRRRQPAQGLYALALLLAFLGFCAYLKWQPYLARLLLPLFVAGAPLAGAALDTAFARIASVPRLLGQGALCLFLLSTARLPALENWTRPLRGAASVLRVSREQQYFSDMVQWGNRSTYVNTLHLLDTSPCRIYGLDITNLPLEYPLQALLRKRQPGARFVHTGVQNTSLRFLPPVDAPPCAVICLDCADDPRRENLYRGFPRKTVVDKFVVFQ